MKIGTSILCVVLLLGCSCKKEIEQTEQVDRYKVFTASWEDLQIDYLTGKMNPSIVTQKRLMKLDSVTGRVWYWESLTEVSSTGKVDKRHGWTEMTDSEKQ